MQPAEISQEHASCPSQFSFADSARTFQLMLCRQLDLNQRAWKTCSRPCQHVRRWDARPLKGLFTVGRRRSQHIALHVSQPRATGAGSHVRAR